MQLRDYQERDLEQIRGKVRAGIRRILYKLATGGGKTVMVSSLAERTASNGKVFFFVVHRRELITQASNTFEHFGVPHGIIAPGYTETDDLVQVASIDAVVSRMTKGRIYTPDVISWDEAHHCASPKWVKVSEKIGNPKTIHIGLTATPERLDGRGIDNMFSDMIQGPETADLIEDGYLCPFRHFEPPSRVDVSKVKIVDGDYYQPQLRDLVDHPAVVGDVIEHYRKHTPNMRAVVFCVGIEHSKHVAAAFQAAGINAQHIDGKNSTQRTHALAAFAANEVKVITNCDIISEGFDVPAMEVVIMLRPTESLTLYLQQAGRALRPVYAKGFDLNTRQGRIDAIAASSKPTAIIMDHAGNRHRHGAVDARRTWLLQGRRRSVESEGGAFVPPIRQCPKCFAVHPPAPKCPSCGHAYEVESIMPDVIKGELQEVTGEEATTAFIKRQLNIEIAKADSLDALMQIAAHRGYKTGWAIKRWEIHPNHPLNRKKQGKFL